jgi:Zn-dependent protease
MIQQQTVEGIFQVIVLLFAISVHESAHAWTASRCGDPTARMLGRVSLNPIKHIDLFGSIILPLMLILMKLPPFGWAKPTPVDPRNLKRPVRDDILTAMAGPASNFLLALISVLLIAAMQRLGLAAGAVTTPLAMLLEFGLVINVMLAVFNLLPLPPLDGSHVFRHMLPERERRAYDLVGMIGLVLLLFFGGNLLYRLSTPVINAFTIFLR